MDGATYTCKPESLTLISKLQACKSAQYPKYPCIAIWLNIVHVHFQACETGVDVLL